MTARTRATAQPGSSGQGAVRLPGTGPADWPAGIEFRDLRYFAVVAEELHFGRAAKRLGLAQPPLSRAIARLERRLDVRLLERTSRRVILTPAGHVFLVESRKATRLTPPPAAPSKQPLRRL